jgi:glycosyltransferase involved in cell wall biosynthesis
MINKKIICRITDSFPPPWSGLNPGPYELSLAQIAQGHLVHVITKKTKDKIIDSSMDLDVHRVWGKSIFFEFSILLKFILLNKRFSFDVLHFHGSVGVILASIVRIWFPKIVISRSIHCVRKSQYKKSLVDRDKFYHLKKCLELFMERRALKNSDILLPVGKNLEDEIVSLWGIDRENCVTIGNGVNLDRFQQSKSKFELRQAYEIDSNTLVLLFVGSLNKRKNENLLIEIFESLQSHNVDVTLIIIGDGINRKSLISSAEENSKDSQKIIFIKNVHYDAISDYFSLADIFVFPSSYEGTPKVIIEAMGCGLPIVASNINAHKNIISTCNGVLVEDFSADAYTAAILSIYGDPYRISQISRTNVELVSQKMTWSIVASNCYSAYTVTGE